MFCPNCGRDCVDGKICLSCGTKLPQGTEKPSVQGVWSVGMTCPYCGANELEGDRCAYCGAQLIFRTGFGQEDLQVSTDSIYRKYGFTTFGRITLGKKAILIRRRILFRTYETQIPYDRITTAIFSRMGKTGYLIVNEGSDAELNPKEYELKKGVASFNVEMDGLLYYHIFCFLRTMAPPTADFTLKSGNFSPSYVDNLTKGFDWEGYFDRFQPFRAPAVKALCMEHLIKPEDSRTLIDQLFDARQKALYEEEPKLAARDLAIVLKGDLQ